MCCVGLGDLCEKVVTGLECMQKGSEGTNKGKIKNKGREKILNGS